MEIDGDLRSLIPVVRKRISNYLGFDVDTISKVTDFAAIFGGAVRDALAKQPINDVDILCITKSRNLLREFLEESGFSKVEKSYGDIFAMYKGLHIINEPITYSNGEAIVQLITPVIPKFKNIPLSDINESHFFEVFYNVLCNVDLSCCGVYYMNNRLYQSHYNAVNNCLTKTFSVLETQMNNPNRIGSRIDKLLSRGWKEIKSYEKSQFPYTQNGSHINRLNSYGKVSDSLIDFEKLKKYLDTK